MDSRENKATIKTGEFMKKLGTLLLTLVLAFTLCACDTEKKEAVKTVDAFYSALEEGSARKAQNYMSDDLQSSLSSLTASIQSIEDMADQYGAEDETNNKLNDAFASVIRLCVKSHKINKTEKVSSSQYKVTVDVEMLDPDDISNALSTLDMNSFMTDISDQVMEKYSSEGEKAAQDFVMSSMADWISKNYTSALSALSYSHETVTVTVENQNGAWLITDMDQ